MLKNLEEPSTFHKQTIDLLIACYALEVFQALNHYLSTLGLCLRISTLQEPSLDSDSEKPIIPPDSA